MERSQIEIPTQNGHDTRTGDGGIRYCIKCGKPIEKIIDFPAFDGSGAVVRRKVHVLCDCEKKEREEKKKRQEYREKQLRIQQLRTISLMDSRLYSAKLSNFAVDDQNRRAFGIASRYVNNWELMKKNHQGLLFYGDVGTGKSFTAAVIANELMDRLHPVIMTSFIKLLADAKGKKFDENGDTINRLNEAALLVIDDLGAERSTDYAIEMVYNVIDGRYRSGKPIILTTNLSLDEMKAEKDIRYSRIYDRIFEMCYPVKFTGLSWRKREASHHYQEMKKILEG